MLDIQGGGFHAIPDQLRRWHWKRRGALAQDPISALNALVELITGLDLPQGIESSLIAKVNRALQLLEAGNEAAAINVLEAFILELEGQKGNQVSVNDADTLIDAAQAVIDRLCL